MTTTSKIYATTPKLIGQRITIRGGAYFIDLVISVIFDLIATSVFSPMAFILVIMQIFPNIDMGRGFYFDKTSLFGTLWGLIVGLSLHVLYFTLFEGMFGRTIGKVLLGLTVVQYDGTKCTMGQAAIRGIYRIVDSLFFGLIAYLNMKPPLYQRIGDKKARTIVVGVKEASVQTKQIGGLFFTVLGVYFVISGIFQVLASLVLFRFA